MSQKHGTFDEEELTSNLSPEVATALLSWLTYLKKSRSSSYKPMVNFARSLNLTKKSPVSHKGKELINTFEIILIRLDPQADLIVRTAEYLIEQNALRMPSP